MQTDRIAELRAAAQQPREPDGYAYRYPDPTGIGRKGVIRFGTGGRSVNGSLPIEAVPYWLGSPPPAQHPVIQAVFRCGPSGEPGDDFIGEKEAPLWGLPEIEDDGSITVPIDHWPTPAQQPTRDLLAEATEQFEALERENHRMRRCVARLMARLTVWLDDDQFNEADGIVHPEFEPPAQQPMVDFDIAIAAGDGTLHGAIDHWQERALTAEAKPPAQQPMSDEQIVNACYTYRHDFGLLPEVERHLLMAEARRWADAFGIGKGESNAD